MPSKPLGPISVNQALATPLQRKRQQTAEWHKMHPDRVAANRRRYRTRLRNHFRGVLSQLMCVRCGERYCAVDGTSNLSFHHRDRGEKGFSIGLADHCWETMISEMEKCDVLCSACHHMIHEAERERDELGRYVSVVEVA